MANFFHPQLKWERNTPQSMRHTNDRIAALQSAMWSPGMVEPLTF
jgi:hypothetical protein